MSSLVGHGNRGGSGEATPRFYPALEYAREEGHAELDQVIVAKDQALEAKDQENLAIRHEIKAKDQAIEELRRKCGNPA